LPASNIASSSNATALNMQTVFVTCLAMIGFAHKGFAIVRFWNHEILRERENVLNTILAQCGLPW
jgi:very-short-patch-repair endonuclease